MLIDNNFLFWHLYQIHTFSNNLNDEEMITSHLMMFERKTVIEKSCQNMLHNKTINKI